LVVFAARTVPPAATARATAAALSSSGASISSTRSSSPNEHPAALFLGDSAASVHGFVLANAAGPGRVTVEGDLPTRGPGNASVQLEGFPVAGLYALRQRDTLGVGGSLTATLNVSGPRAAPVYQGSFSLSNGSFGQFRTPFVDGTVNYAGRRLNGSLNLWRAGQPILSVSAHLPLDLALQEVPRRQLSDTLSVRARADSVGLCLRVALSPIFCKLLYPAREMVVAVQGCV
jgi:autotransporter translocation and assembly factor TamB